MAEPDPRARLIRDLIAQGAPLSSIENWLGPTEEIAALVEVFEREAEARLLMAIARRARIPYSEAKRLWAWDDIVAEVAWDVLQAEQALAQCPDCGINHDDALDPDTGRPLTYSRYKLKKIDCPITAERDRVTKNRIGDEAREAGARFHLVVAVPGEPWIDDGDQPSE